MLNNPFGTGDMAAGYARSRPPIHTRIIERIQEKLQISEKRRRALDVGCGAGLSTKPLEALANECIGIEPAEAMLRWTSETAPNAQFLVGSAESLPLSAQSVDIVAAAGSLNYMSLGVFFDEAARVLSDQGMIVIYDFATARDIRGSDRLKAWFQQFTSRYPWPSGEAATITPESLAQLNCGFKIEAGEWFEIALLMSHDQYVNYMMTETNVAYAVRKGLRSEEIRDWCTATLAPVFEKPAEVLFRGYFVCMVAK